VIGQRSLGIIAATLLVGGFGLGLGAGIVAHRQLQSSAPAAANHRAFPMQPFPGPRRRGGPGPIQPGGGPGGPGFFQPGERTQR
jgi:hypothetical protein